MGNTTKKRRRFDTSGIGERVGAFSVLSRVDRASLNLGRMPRSGSEQPRSRRFATEEEARAQTRRLGEGWEAWTTPRASAWFVRRLPRSAYNPAQAGATYTVLGASDEVLGRYLAADAVPALVRRAGGDASAFDDRDGNCVIAGTDGAPATNAMIGALLDDYEATHVVAPHACAYFTDSNNPGRALTLGQLDYDAAKHYLDPRDERAIEALAPGESHHPLAGDPEEGPRWGIVTRLSAAVQPKAVVRGGVVLGVGFDKEQARADATERSPTDAEAADAEVVNATLAALSGWHDEELRERVYLAADTVRRIDVFDVLPHDDGTPNDPRWATDQGAETGDEGPESARATR